MYNVTINYMNVLLYLHGSGTYFQIFLQQRVDESYLKCTDINSTITTLFMHRYPLRINQIYCHINEHITEVVLPNETF